MSWVRLDDHTNEHVKLLAAGAEAAWLWCCGLMYCNRQKKRDGVIPTEMVTSLYARLTPRRARALAAVLVACGLWEPVSTGFRVHDYHDFQPGADGLAALSEKRKAAGSLGGRAKASRRSSSNASSKLLEAPRAGIGRGSVASSSEGGVGGVLLQFPGRKPPSTAASEDDLDALDDDGFMVDAWLDEMGQRTGEIWNRRSMPLGNLKTLAAALGERLDPAGDRCAGSRAFAAEYYAKQKGNKLGILQFTDWLRNGRPDRLATTRPGRIKQGGEGMDPAEGT